NEAFKGLSPTTMKYTPIVSSKNFSNNINKTDEILVKFESPVNSQALQSSTPLGGSRRHPIAGFSRNFAETPRSGSRSQSDAGWEYRKQPAPSAAMYELHSVFSSPNSIPKYSERDVMAIRKELSQKFDAEFDLVQLEFQELEARRAKAVEEAARLRATLDEWEVFMKEMIAKKEMDDVKHQAEVRSLRTALEKSLASREKLSQDHDELLDRNRLLRADLEDERQISSNLRAANEEILDQLKTSRNQFENLKSHAEHKLESANVEIARVRNGFEKEIASLKVKVTRAELHISSLEKTVETKTQENMELTKICDDLLMQPQMGANESSPIDPNPPSAGPRSALTHPNGGERSAMVFTGFDSAPARELRPVFSALIAKAVSLANAEPPPSSDDAPDIDDAILGHSMDVVVKEPSSCVKVYISCGNSDDWIWERNALVKDVWPFLRRFCKVLDLDFEPVDRTWNVPNAAMEVSEEKAQRLLWECINESAGPAFFCFLGDKYGSPALPKVLPAVEYELILDGLENHRSNDEEGNAQDFLKTWFVKDTNQSPSPVYSLVPVEYHFPGIYSADNFAVFIDATSKWEAARSRLMTLLKDGAEVSLPSDNEVWKKLHASVTEFEVSVASSCRAKDMQDVDKDKFLDKYFSFRRTFVKPPEGVNDSFYFDDPSNEVDPTAMAKLATKIRPKRSYSVPWNSADSIGFSPSSDKSHAAYLKTFCDDVARLLAESILKHYSASALNRETNKLRLEMNRQIAVVDGLARNFVGRKHVLETLFNFLQAPEGDDGVFVLYGPSGIGKSATLAKTAQILSDAKSHAVVSRFIGKTEDSSSLRSLLASICLQISGIYGIDDLKAAISQEIEALADLVDNTAGASSSADSLFEILEKWPPVSLSGLKLGLEIAMSLATPETPLVLILDGLHELNVDSDVLNVDWLPSVVPPNVKIILSALPVSKKQSLFLSVCSKYPTATALAEEFIDGPTTAQYYEIPAFTADEVSSLIAVLLSSNNRALTPEQLAILTTKCQSSSMPLYIISAWELCARKWTSSYQFMKKELQAETLPGLFEDYLDACENKWGRVFVASCLSYITAARNGLSKNELTDVLSCDTGVLGEIFKSQEPAIWRVNSVSVSLLLEDLRCCFSYKMLNGLEVIFWASVQFKTVAQERYLYGERQSNIHKSLASYWRDKLEKDHTRSAKHFIFRQTLLIYGKPNDRRISSIAWHLLNCGVSGFTEAVKTLQNISYLGAAIGAGLLDEVLECYKFALESMGNNVYAEQLTEYYRFLVLNYNALANSPRSLIPLAANLYATSVVSGDVRSWIKAQAPELNWMEWVNRPTSRGEPIAVLKPEDVSQGVTVTCRDTFANLVAVAGICESDGLPALSLFDMNYKPMSVVPDERAKLLAFAIVDLSDEEQGLPLVCSFSRGGKALVVASRSLVFYNTAGLSLAGSAMDPSLPEGDIITAIAWTKDDGCVVTASDGAEPGRIVLWDAGSFSFLRVIKSQYPRQPICSAFSTIGFWDEYRELFILLDVDELASDAESGLFLQYIPTKAHCDPPPDGCARFALAHKSPLVLVGDDDGLGYTLIDFRAKRPVGHVEVDIDTVRSVSLSSDGTKVAVFPHEGKVIHIFGTTDGIKDSMKDSQRDFGDLSTFVHLGTILGGDVEQPICLFSRNRQFIVTDGEFGQTQVWSIDDLGDHSTVRYHSMLPALIQGIAPVMNSSSCAAWSIPENKTEVSLSDAKAKMKVRTFDVSVEEDSAGSKDILVAVSGHQEKPFTVVVTDQGYLSLLYNENISVEGKGWMKGLWNSKKVGDGLLATYSVWRDEDYTSPSAVAFLSNYGTNLPATVNGSAVEHLTIATGHEDGSLRIWEWSSIAEDLSLLLHLPFKFGRITSIVPSNMGSKTVAVTVDDSTVAIWDGLTPSTKSVSVIIPPRDVSPAVERSSFLSTKFRRSSSSVWSSSNLSDQNVDRPTVVAFSNLSDRIFATGEADGAVTIWSLDLKLKRELLTHADKPGSPFGVMSFGWSLDDGALVTLCEDKRITIHNSETGELVWIHEIWMISPPLKLASFVTGARQLGVMDIYGSFTLVNLHGKWPLSKSGSSKTRFGAIRNALTTSATKITSILSINSGIDSGHPITSSNFSTIPQEQETFITQEWDAAIAGKLSQNRAEAHTKSSDQWEYTTGSGSHGHVALLRLDSGLYRGTYEVICEVEIPEFTSTLRASNSSAGIPLKFVCGTNSSNPQDLKIVVDPELEMIRGFTRYLPPEEQKMLGGMGKVSLRLGYLKAVCNITTCYIDLKRIPGEGEVFKLGTVHFIPVDPVLYTPSYKCPPELKVAFESISRKFREFEDRHRRRGSLLNSVISDRLSSQASVPELKAALIRAASFTDDVDEEEVDKIVQSVPVVENSKTVSVGAPPPQASSRLSILQPFTTVVANVSGLLSSMDNPRLSKRESVHVKEDPLSPTMAKEARAVPNFEDIQREMAAARKRANEEAMRLEEEDERLAAVEARDREMRGMRNEFERNARMSILKMVKGEQAYSADFVQEPEELDFEVPILQSDEERILAESILAKVVEIEASINQSLMDPPAASEDRKSEVEVDTAALFSASVLGVELVPVVESLDEPLDDALLESVTPKLEFATDAASEDADIDVSKMGDLEIADAEVIVNLSEDGRHGNNNSSNCGVSNRNLASLVDLLAKDLPENPLENHSEETNKPGDYLEEMNDVVEYSEEPNAAEDDSEKAIAAADHSDEENDAEDYSEKLNDSEFRLEETNYVKDLLEVREDESSVGKALPDGPSEEATGLKDLSEETEDLSEETNDVEEKSEVRPEETIDEIENTSIDAFVDKSDESHDDDEKTENALQISESMYSPSQAGILDVVDKLTEADSMEGSAVEVLSAETVEESAALPPSGETSEGGQRTLSDSSETVEFASETQMSLEDFDGVEVAKIVESETFASEGVDMEQSATQNLAADGDRQHLFSPEEAHDASRVGNYLLTETIGEGTFGKVKLSVDIRSGEKLAIKVIQKSKIKTAKQMNSVQREVRLMKLLKHPHIVEVKETLENKEQIFLVMELASGGELFDYIAQQCHQDEDMARLYFRQVVSAISYCHQNSIIHRDLKPENLLLDKDGNIKIIDFGFGNTFHRDRTLDTFCGSPYYAAPEMVKGIPYTGPEVDIWSMGVILYALITGNLPFDSRDMIVLYTMIAKGEYDPIRSSDSKDIVDHPWTNYGQAGKIDPKVIPRPAIVENPSAAAISILVSYGIKEQEIRRLLGMDCGLHPIKSLYFLVLDNIQSSGDSSGTENQLRSLSTPNLAMDKRSSENNVDLNIYESYPAESSGQVADVRQVERSSESRNLSIEQTNEISFVRQYQRTPENMAETNGLCDVRRSSVIDAGSVKKAAGQAHGSKIFQALTAVGFRKEKKKFRTQQGIIILHAL
ncbi:NUAK SNF1-like kinase 1, partial [Entophlyctis luteolus]